MIADVTNAFNKFCSAFKFKKLSVHQRKAIELFVIRKKNIAVNLSVQLKLSPPPAHSSTPPPPKKNAYIQIANICPIQQTPDDKTLFKMSQCT